MTHIRHRIQTTYPSLAPGFFPVEMIHLDAIPRDDEITGWFHLLASKIHIGTQYEWLARFAKYNATELELSIERFLPEDSELFGNLIQPFLKGEGHACRVEGPFPEPGMELFTWFRFPIIHLTKSEMRIISEKEGFIDIMKLTWFCLDPQRGLPCGRCRPCNLASASGLANNFYRPTIGDRIEGVVKRLHK